MFRPVVVVLASLAWLALALVCLAPGTATAGSSLVLSSADFSTLHLRPMAESVGAARAEVGAGLTSGVRRALRTAQVQASGATARGQRWSSDAFVLGSASAASRVLGAGDPNAASSWSAPQTLSPAPSLDSNAQLAGGPAGIFVARSIATPGDHERFVVQRFTGSGWTSPVAIATEVEGQRFAIAQTPAGIVYVIWKNSSGRLQYAIATSPAATHFGAPQTLSTRCDVEFPQIAVDAHGAGWATWTNASSPTHAFAVPIIATADH